MINSSERKRALIGWLNDNSADEFWPATKTQKFLFFYECFCKIDGGEYDFDGLKAYKHGPVFGAVYSEMKYNETGYNERCRDAFLSRGGVVDVARAKLAKFVVGVLGNTLSDFTHAFHFWNAKLAEVEKGVKNIPMDEADFNETDENILRGFQKMYPENEIDGSILREVCGKTFLTRKEDAAKFNTSEVYDILYEAALDSDFHTPVYVNFDAEGGVILD